ncbi:MAG TPA: hypothetical protein VFP72_17665 [Kineosporiaceae bacterium]|nr:hypothetical protein [Kineosporiaceae bacterium]
MDVIGWIGSAILVLSLAQTRVLRFRAMNLVAAVILVVFNAAVMVWPMAAVNAVIAAVDGFVLIRLARARHDHRAYEVVSIDPDQPYLGYLLERNASDIAKFNPGLGPDIRSRAELAFLTLNEGETVGVVLARRTEVPGEAELLLDYVAPRFRDFTPGEFVFRPDGPFPRLGVHRVLAPRGMREASAYLAAVGFRPESDGLVLQLPMSAA